MLINCNAITIPILTDANTRDDRAFADAILELLETGNALNSAARRLNRDDRRNLLILRDHLRND